MWTNFAHLLLVSLLPFTTAWMAQTKLAATPVMVYAGLFVCADGAYNLLEHHILKRTDEYLQTRPCDRAAPFAPGARALRRGDTGCGVRAVARFRDWSAQRSCFTSSPILAQAELPPKHQGLPTTHRLKHQQPPDRAGELDHHN